MAMISGTFSSPSAGRLRITLSGVFTQGVPRTGGFPTGTSNILLKATINGFDVPPIDRFAPVTYAEMDYPGGNVSWAVSTTVVSTSAVGIATFSMTNLLLTLQLVKK